MTDEIKAITIKLGPRSFEQAADDLEQIARAVRGRGLWNLSPAVLSGASVELTLPEPEQEEVDDVAKSSKETAKVNASAKQKPAEPDPEEVAKAEEKGVAAETKPVATEEAKPAEKSAAKTTAKAKK